MVLPCGRPMALALRRPALPALRSFGSAPSPASRRHAGVIGAGGWRLLRSPVASPVGGSGGAPFSTDSAKADPLGSLPGPVKENFVGMGQVVFCNSVASGALILGGLFFGDPWLGTCSAISLVSATTMARAASIDDDMVSNGLASYNGALVGCAFSVFLPGTWDPTIMIASALGGAWTPILAVALKNTFSMPQWTLAFNFTVLPPLLYHKPFSQPPPADAPAAVEAVVTAQDWALSPLVGISQIFVVESAISGALILAGIAVYSKEAAAHTLLGSTIGVATGVAMGADPSAITAGLWGFNPALTSLAVSVFFTPSAGMYGLSAGGAGVTSVLAAGIGPVFGAFGSPACTMPFCMAVSACYQLGSSIPSISPAVNPHSPEVNRVDTAAAVAAAAAPEPVAEAEAEEKTEK